MKIPTTGYLLLSFIYVFLKNYFMKYILIAFSIIISTPFHTKAQQDKSTTVPKKVIPTKENILFSNWTEAKTNCKWQWLETNKDDANVFRSFYKANNLNVFQKNKNYSWTQTNLPYEPFSVYWYYEATINKVPDGDNDAEVGLMLNAKANGQLVNFYFLINHFNQTYYFSQVNINTNTWMPINKQIVANQNNFSAAILKFNPNKDYTTNKIKIQREGNNFLLYINNILVETIKITDPLSTLNKLNGIGILGKGNQGYFVDYIKFVFFTDAKTSASVTSQNTIIDKNNSELGDDFLDKVLTDTKPQEKIEPQIKTAKDEMIVKYNDDFTTKKYWQSFDETFTKIADGKLTIASIAGKTIDPYYRPFVRATDFSVSVEATHISGIDNNAFGFFIRSADATEKEHKELVLGISAGGRYSINYGDKTLVDWKINDNIKKNNGANTLMIKRIGNTYSLYINNVLVETFNNLFTFEYFDVGMMTVDKQTVEFDNLIIKAK